MLCLSISSAIQESYKNENFNAGALGAASVFLKFYIFF